MRARGIQFPQEAPQASPKALQPKPSPKDVGFLDPSLQHDFPKLCLYRGSHAFCNHIEQSRFDKADTLELLPKCLRGEALIWFRQSKYQDLAECLQGWKARFPPPSQLSPHEALYEALREASQATSHQAPDYHYCKLCNASFSPVARLIRHTQENVCNKPCCRHCEMVFPSKNRLHQHLRDECQNKVHRRSSSASSSASSRRSSLTCPPACSPSPPPRHQMISPPPPAYLTIDDLFRMFGGRSTTTAASTITITIDDPFIRPFVSLKKSMGSTSTWEIRIGNRHKLSPSSAGAMCSSPQRCISWDCCRIPSLNTDNRDAKALERHHFKSLAKRCAQKSHSFPNFNFFDFSILNPMASNPSTLAHSYYHWILSSLLINHLMYRSN